MEIGMNVLDYAALRDRGIRYTKTHLWRLWTSGQFPKPTKIGGGRNVWLESEIDAYIKARLAARDQVAA
jgi:prophage regulatory protein